MHYNYWSPLFKKHSDSYATIKSVNIAEATVNLEGHAKIVGVTLDRQLTVDDHVKAVVKQCLSGSVAASHFVSPPLWKTWRSQSRVAYKLVSQRLKHSLSLHQFSLQPLSTNSECSYTVLSQERVPQSDTLATVTSMAADRLTSIIQARYASM